MQWTSHFWRKENSMKKTAKILIIALSFGTAISLPASANTQALAVCLTDSLNGKERKQLAKWIYFSIAAHPEMKPYSNISADVRTDTDKYVGTLVTRLLVDDCASQLKIAQKTDPNSLQKAFELVGQVAMQEIMTNPDVTSTIGSYSKYVDQKRISSILAEE
jgi:hypothetical protein